MKYIPFPIRLVYIDAYTIYYRLDYPTSRAVPLLKLKCSAYKAENPYFISLLSILGILPYFLLLNYSTSSILLTHIIPVKGNPYLLQSPLLWRVHKSTVLYTDR